MPQQWFTGFQLNECFHFVASSRARAVRETHTHVVLQVKIANVSLTFFIVYRYVLCLYILFWTHNNRWCEQENEVREKKTSLTFSCLQTTTTNDVVGVWRENGFWTNQFWAAWWKRNERLIVVNNIWEGCERFRSSLDQTGSEFLKTLLMNLNHCWILLNYFRVKNSAISFGKQQNVIMTRIWQKFPVLWLFIFAGFCFKTKNIEDLWGKHFKLGKFRKISRKL